MAGLKLLPGAADKCQECAGEHPPEAPHNQQSLYYQYRFYGQHGRWPTWADAIAHCDETTRQLWQQELTRLGHWSEPTESPEQ